MRTCPAQPTRMVPWCQSKAASTLARARGSSAAMHSTFVVIKLSQSPEEQHLTWGRLCMASSNIGQGARQPGWEPSFTWVPGVWYERAIGRGEVAQDGAALWQALRLPACHTHGAIMPLTPACVLAAKTSCTALEAVKVTHLAPICWEDLQAWHLAQRVDCQIFWLCVGAFVKGEGLHLNI